MKKHNHQRLGKSLEKNRFFTEKVETALDNKTLEFFFISENAEFFTKKKQK